MSTLHWSVDYSHQTSERDFCAELLRSLSPALASPALNRDAKRKVHRYSLLPNFWTGFKGYPADDPDLAIGAASIERFLDDNGAWQYHVRHANATSGEELELAFVCDDLPARPLSSPWLVRARNSADGTYDAITLIGEVLTGESGAAIALTTQRGLSFSAGAIQPSTTLTCNWALFDILAAPGATDLGGLAILEDLEMLKPNCCIRPLETWPFEVDGETHTLSGYCVFGEGFPPSYWWLTETGDIAVMSTMLLTYVLREREGEAK
jgi:hypothetical protein